ncbi:Phosphoribosylglycinamide formyltransferase, partial [hydrothermal vent metagenome]
DRDIVIHLKDAGIDFVVLAGYMKILSAYFIKQFPSKVLNVHPSLLPSYKGARGIKDAFTYGAKVTGVTIHFVDSKMDHGPIILQESIKIKEKDTLESLDEKIHSIEHRIFPKVIKMFVEGRLKISGRKVQILDHPPAAE